MTGPEQRLAADAAARRGRRAMWGVLVMTAGIIVFALLVAVWMYVIGGPPR